MLSFQHVLKALLGHGVGELDFKLPEAFIDSRAMSEGGLFFALRGERTDGHLYVRCFSKGAILAILIIGRERSPISNLSPRNPNSRAPARSASDRQFLLACKSSDYRRNQFDIKVMASQGGRQVLHKRIDRQRALQAWYA
jgi:UDP-N-acetylmuramyl pentapeptide synthase